MDLARRELSTSDRDRRRLCLVLGLSSLVGLLAVLAARISWFRAFAIDEFAYAHAAWLIADGAVPHLDFFETKFTGPLWLFALVFSVGGDDPHLVQALRILIWPLVGIIVIAAGSLNKHTHPLAPLVTTLVLLANPVFTNTALEIRPDVVALAALMGALMLVIRGSDGRTVGIAIGVLLGLCAWGTAKSIIYAAPLALFWIYEQIRPGHEDERIFRSPWSVAFGFSGVVTAVASMLVVSGSLDEFVAQTITHNRQFLVGQRWRPWQLDAAFVFWNAPWFHALALVGLASLAWQSPSRNARMRRFDLLLMALVVSAFCSHALQLYPFHYSLLPFMALEAIFAGRGLVFLVNRAVGSSSVEGPASRPWKIDPVLRLAAVGLVSWSAVGMAKSSALLFSLGAVTNQAQIALLDEVERVTVPSDPIYDNSGSYVARRNAYFLPWTDAPIRTLWAEKLVREVPEAIEASECVVAVRDERFASLPEPLTRYLLAHFKPWAGGDVLLWGADFMATDGEAEGVFFANRSGHYRIQPPEIASEGGLTIDGSRVERSIIELERGRHPVHYAGAREGFRLQWFPGDARLATR